MVAGEARDEMVREALKAFDETPEGNVAEHYYYPSKWREPYLGRRRALGWGLYGLLGIERGQKDKMHAQHARNYKFFDAPVGMFFAMDRDMEHGSWTDCGMFMQSVMLAARSRGLQSCAQAAWMDMHKVIRRVLGMPEDRIIVAGMSLGYEDESARVNEFRTDRLPVDEFAYFYGF